jgi:hypothetical protein
VKSRQLTLPNFIRMLIDSDIAVPSGSEVLPDGSGFQPLLFDKSGTKMVSCFTSKERVAEFIDLAPYCLVMDGGEFLRRIPPEYGLVINPGQPVGFDVTPQGLAKIVRDFAT